MTIGMEAKMVLLEVSRLTKQFGGLVALDKVNLLLHEGEVLGIVGPNGSGKTTLFNLISGIYHPTSGSICFQGEHIAGKKPYSICRMGIARTYQLVRPFLNLSVLENILVGACFGNGRKKDATCTKEAMSILDLINLSQFYKRPAGMLTVAQRKRLEIGRALATGPRIILLDEVMAGLNAKEVDDVVILVNKIFEMGITACVIEHVMKAVSMLCSRTVVLNNGRVIFEGKPEKMSQDEEVIKAYLGTKRSKEVA
jgi:branched-chain amino acid transport system ATP-binding protein